MFRQIAENVWAAEEELRLAGIRLSVRMTVIQLEDGGLWLHSPLDATDARCAALDELGPVRYAIAPSRWHHLYIGSYRARYPDAKLFGAPGLAKKRQDVAFDGALGNEPDAAWAKELDQTVLDGSRMASEVVFLHRSSRTLLCSDSFFNLRPSDHWWTKFYQRVSGTANGPCVSRLFKWTIREKAAMRASIDHVLTWDFDRVVMGHGAIIETDGQAALKTAYGFLS